MIAPPARAFRDPGAGILLLVALTLAAGTAQGGNRLQEITDRWRKTRAQEVPIEVYLRPLVQSDSAFVVDSTRTVEHLAPDVRTAFDELEPLLSYELQLQFLGLSSDSLRGEWVRRYWRLRDPTPTTPANERRTIHEARVAAARQQFSTKGQPGWDDRGGVWIAFGAPDSIIEDVASVEEGVGYIPAHAEWLYLAEKWVVEFERPNPRRPWTLGHSSARLSQRPDLVGRDKLRLGYTSLPNEARGASDYERMNDIIGLQDDRELLAQSTRDNPSDEGLNRDIVTHTSRTDLRAKNLLEKKRQGVVRFRAEYEKGADRFALPGAAPNPLWYVFDVDVFKGPPGRMRVELHYQLNLQDLKFRWADSVYVASYKAEAVLLDRTVHEAGRDDYTETIKAADFRTTMAAQLIPGQLVFNVPEGDYQLAVRIWDPASQAAGTYTTRVEVPRLDGRMLATSDVLMASSIVFADDKWKSRFVKQDRLIVPNPIGAYAKGKQLTGYFEIYGLRPDAQGMTRYEVRYLIAPRSVARSQGFLPGEGSNEKPFVTSSFKNESVTADVVEELRVDVGELASDTYDLVLTIKDLVAGAETTSRTAFSILQ